MAADEAGWPVERAQVRVFEPGEGAPIAHVGVTDQSGECRFTDLGRLPPSRVEVQADGFAYYSVRDQDVDFSADGFRATLREGATLIAVVVDERTGQPISKHPVDLYLQRIAGVEPDVSSAAWKEHGVRAHWRGFTDIRGVAEFEVIERGTWEVRCGDWRDLASTKHHRADASHGMAEVVLEAGPRWDTEEYTSGVISFEGPPRVGASSVVPGYRIAKEGSPGQLLSWIYYIDGRYRFYAPCRGRESLDLIVVETDEYLPPSRPKRVSAPITIECGRHDIALKPEWL